MAKHDAGDKPEPDRPATIEGIQDRYYRLFDDWLLAGSNREAIENGGVGDPASLLLMTARFVAEMPKEEQDLFWQFCSADQSPCR